MNFDMRIHSKRASMSSRRFQSKRGRKLSRRSSITKHTSVRRFKKTYLANLLQSGYKYTFVRDSYLTWSTSNQICAAGKPIVVSQDYITIFFDDNALVTPKCWGKKTLEYEKIKLKQADKLSHTLRTFGTANVRDENNDFVNCTPIDCTQIGKIQGEYHIDPGKTIYPTQLLAIFMNTKMNCGIVNVCYEPSLRQYFTSENQKKMYIEAYKKIVYKIDDIRGDKPKLPIHLHFDINKTIIPFDSYEKNTMSSSMDLFPCFKYLHNRLKNKTDVHFFFRSFGKDHDKVYDLLGKPDDTSLIIVTPTDNDSSGQFSSYKTIEFPKEYSKDNCNVNSTIKEWKSIKKLNEPIPYEYVKHMVQQYPPNLAQLMSQDCCSEFPNQPDAGATCCRFAKHSYIDLTQHDKTDIQKQCTQLALQCQDCNGIIAFDGGLKPNTDGTYTTPCNKTCKTTQTFMLTTSPCDLMGICHGVGKANFNTYASIYAYNDDYIAIHDYGNLAPIHFLIIPTKVAIPDVLSMCVKPSKSECKTGAQVLNEMKTMALNIFCKMCGLEEKKRTDTVYAPNLRTMGEMYTLKDDDANEVLDDGFPKKLLAVFNMPGSQSQLHLQVLVLPLFRTEMNKVFTLNETSQNWCHFGWPRTIPFRLAERIVSRTYEHAPAKIVGTTDNLSKSDWYNFCRHRLDTVKHDETFRPFLEGKRNDILVLPQCFYHSNLPEGTPMDEFLGRSYRSELENFITGRTQSSDSPAQIDEATVNQYIDATTKNIKSSNDYLTMLSKTAYTKPKSNIVTKYFIKRLSN